MPRVTGDAQSDALARPGTERPQFSEDDEDDDEEDDEENRGADQLLPASRSETGRSQGLRGAA